MQDHIQAQTSNGTHTYCNLFLVDSSLLDASANIHTHTYKPPCKFRLTTLNTWTNKAKNCDICNKQPPYKAIGQVQKCTIHTHTQTSNSTIKIKLCMMPPLKRTKICAAPCNTWLALSYKYWVCITRCTYGSSTSCLQGLAWVKLDGILSKKKKSLPSKRSTSGWWCVSHIVLDLDKRYPYHHNKEGLQHITCRWPGSLECISTHHHCNLQDPRSHQ